MNHNALSGPVTIIDGALPTEGQPDSSPSTEIRPMSPDVMAVNHSAPSAPAVMPNGPLPSANPNSANSPAIVIRPIRSSPVRVNHIAPSGPAVMIDGRDCGPIG